MQAKLKQGLNFLSDVFRDEQFYVALRHVLGALIPLIVCELLGRELLGLQMMLGALFISGVDIAGTLRAKASGLCITTVLSLAITFLLLLPDGRLWAIVSLLFIMVFCLAYISPYSLRYTMIAVMGYLAIILALAFGPGIHTIHEILIHCFHLLWGSVWYILYALTIHYFASTREINRRVAFCMRQTADYFDQRLAMLEPDTDHEEGLLKLAGLQQELNDTQESIRELLFEHPSILTNRNSKQHRFYTIFVELIDMHEMAVASPVDFPKTRRLLYRYPEYNVIRKIIRQVDNEMHNLADVLLQRAKHQPLKQLTLYVEQLQGLLQEFEQRITLVDSDEQEIYDTLKRIEEYLLRQLQRVDKMRSAVLDVNAEKPESNESSAGITGKDIPRFIRPNPLNRNSLAGNFSFDSSFFRYALRTAVTAVLGYIIGYSLHVQNPYWVLLTVLLVMKPGYGVTRQRFFHRTGGTVIGALVAFGIYQTHPSHVVSLVVFGVAFLLAFAFVVKNYAVASGFFTIFVIFLYSFLNRPIPISIIFRVADTILGAVLVIVAIFYLWPHWEHQKFGYYLKHSLRANKNYLVQVLNNLFGKSFDEMEYRLARKHAYVEMAEVVSSFSRLRNEPESRQKNARPFYNLALSNYMLLSGITSLAIFVQRHPGLSVPDEELHNLGNRTIANLDYTLQRLADPLAVKKPPANTVNGDKTDQPQKEIQQKLAGLKERINRQGKDSGSDLYSDYVDLRYLTRQLIWMLDLSRSIIEHVQQAR